MSTTRPALPPILTKRPLATGDGNAKTHVKMEEFSDVPPTPSDFLPRDTEKLEDPTSQVTEKYRKFLDAWEGKYDNLATPSSASASSPTTSRPVSAIGSFNFSESAKSPSGTTTYSLPPRTPLSATSKTFRYSLHFPPISPGVCSSQGATPISATHPRFRYSGSTTPRSAGPFGTRTVTTVTRTLMTVERTQLHDPPKAKRRKHQENPPKPE